MTVFGGYVNDTAQLLYINTYFQLVEKLLALIHHVVVFDNTNEQILLHQICILTLYQLMTSIQLQVQLKKTNF